MPWPSVICMKAAFRYLCWLAWSQKGRVALGATLGSLWMVGLTLPPYLLSRAIDDGLATGDASALTAWTGALLATGVATAWLAGMRHRTMTKIRMDANFRTVGRLVEQVNRLGASLTGRLSAGEVVTIGIGDVITIAASLTVTGPGVGAVLSCVVVALLLLQVSVPLAVVVLVGVPVLVVAVGPLLRGHLRVQGDYRDSQGGLTGRLVDVIEGLRVLNAFGGKQAYAERFRHESAGLREQGYRVAALTSWISALGTGLPALFLAAVTWLAARLAAEGTITVGELVAVYGYIAMLIVPLSFFIEGGYQISHGLVAARQVTRFLALEPPAPGTAPAPGEPAFLHDPLSGLEVAPGRLTGLVSARPEESAAVLERLGGFEPAATWDGTPVGEIAGVRARVLVADHDAAIFTGTLREVLSGRGEHDDESLCAALHAAAAQDVAHHGLDSVIEAGGRNLSGGQRQRVRLARALLSGPDVLLAAEPTSALDATTEALVAERLRTARDGRTTVVATTSRLLLAQADTVCLLRDGRVVETGTHDDLLGSSPVYRAVLA